jgi:hypothetical protein
MIYNAISYYTWGDTMSFLSDEIATCIAEILAFYADERNYYQLHPLETPPIMLDNGELARKIRSKMLEINELLQELAKGQTLQ